MLQSPNTASATKPSRPCKSCTRFVSGDLPKPHNPVVWPDASVAVACISKPMPDLLCLRTELDTLITCCLALEDLTRASVIQQGSYCQSVPAYSQSVGMPCSFLAGHFMRLVFRLVFTLAGLCIFRDVPRSAVAGGAAAVQRCPHRQDGGHVGALPRLGVPDTGALPDVQPRRGAPGPADICWRPAPRHRGCALQDLTCCTAC